jgi:hypothetical protein
MKSTMFSQGGVEMDKNSQELIKQIMRQSHCKQLAAEMWADRYCGDWLNTPIPKAKVWKS